MIRSFAILLGVAVASTAAAYDSAPSRPVTPAAGIELPAIEQQAHARRSSSRSRVRSSFGTSTYRSSRPYGYRRQPYGYGRQGAYAAGAGGVALLAAGAIPSGVYACSTRVGGGTANLGTVRSASGSIDTSTLRASGASFTNAVPTPGGMAIGYVNGRGARGNVDCRRQ